MIIPNTDDYNSYLPTLIPEPANQRELLRFRFFAEEQLAGRFLSYRANSIKNPLA